MSFWILLQVILDLFIVAGIAGLWIKRSRPAKDDPRLSRGLQLLQTKISILEDLADRTETQANQLTALMEAKGREVQGHLHDADRQVQRIDQSLTKSLEVAKIFQDRIPHQEIIERQNTKKYVAAARLAHQGQSVEDIAKQVDLSRGEIEFIAKVNRENLQFSEDSLPEWATETSEPQAQQAAGISPRPLIKEEDKAASVTLSDLGDRFRQAMQSTSPIVEPAAPAPRAPTPAPAQQLRTLQDKPAAPVMEMGTKSRGQQVQVKRVVFPRVERE